MPDTNINYPIALKNQPGLIDKAVIVRKNMEALKPRVRSARTAATDSDKMFAVYFNNKNATINFAAKGFVYVNTLLRSLTMRTHYHDTQSQPKVKLDTLIASDVANTISSKFIAAIPETTIIVDSQARKVYYTFGSFEVYVKGDFAKVKEHADILSMFFNDVKLSSTAIKDEKTSSAKPNFNFESKGFVPLVSIEKMKIPDSLSGMSSNFRPSSKEYPKEIAVIPEFNIEYVESAVNSVFGEQKTIDINSRTVEITFRVTIRMVYPLAYAYWATYAKSSANFSIPNFFNLITGHIVGAAGKQRADQSVARLIPMQTSIDILQERVTKLSLVQEPRINRNRFTILGDGDVLYIPPDGDLKQYDSMIKESYDPQTKKVTPLTQLRDLHNIYLFSDWVHNVGIYTNTSGVINTINFIGAMAFEDRFVARYFKQKDFTRAFSLEIGVFLNIAKDIASRANVNISDLVPQDSDIHHYSIDMLFSRVLTMASIYDVTYGDIFDMSSNYFTELGDSDKEIIPIFMKVNEALFKAMFKVKTNYSIINLMYFALPFYIFGIAAPRIKKYNDVYNKQKEENTKDPTTYLTTMQTKIQLPNLPGCNDGLLPHQGSAYLSTLHKGPKLVSIDVSAGGGKCQVGSTNVPTTNGIFTIKELYNSSADFVKNGNKKLSGINVYSNAGIVPAAEAYKTKGKTHRIKFNDGTVVEGLAEHRYHDSKDFVRLDKMKSGHWFPKENQTNLYGNIIDLGLDQELFSEYTNVLTPNLAKLLGYIISEGHVSEHRDQLTITNHNKDIQKNILSYLKEIFDEDFKFEDNTVKINKKIQRDYLRCLVNRATSARHTVPMCIRQAPKELQIEFIKALYEGDGCIYSEVTESGTRWKLEYSSISSNITRQLKTLLENIGFNVLVRKKRGYWSNNGNASKDFAFTKRHAYTVYIHFTEIPKFAKEIGFISKVKNSQLARAVKHFNWLSTKASQKTNLLSHGWVNKVPVGEIVGDALRYIDVLCNKHSRTVAFGSQTRTVQFNIRYLLKHVNWSDTYKYAHKIIDGNNPADNRYTAAKFVEFVENMHTCNAVSINALRDIQQNKTVQKYLTEVQQIIKKSWCFVKSANFTNKVRTVYDLVVPGPQNYVSAGMLSHNTLLMIIDMVTLLNTKKIKRPLILCPAKLVSEWVSEVNKWSQGELNPYPLTGNSVTKLSKYLGYDRNKLLETIRNAPPNTVFIASYSFLKVADPFKDTTASKMQYGGTVVNFYPNTQFVRQGGFDYVSCFVGETKVSTEKGLLSIKNIVSNNHPMNIRLPYSGNLKVVTPNGLKKITHTYKSKKEAFKITTSLGYSIKPSGDHPIRVLTPELDLIWKTVDECKPGDYVCLESNRHKFNKLDSSINYIPDLVYDKKTRFPTSLTPDLAKFLGYFISEGNYTDMRVEFTNNNVDLVRDFASLIQRLFGIKPEIDYYTRNNKTTSRVRINNRDIIGFLQYLGVKTGSANKKVPTKLYSSSKDSVVEFLRAYYEGDGGNNSGTGICATSKSKKLLEGTQLLLLMFNITSTIRKSVDLRWDKPINIYYLDIGKENSEKFMRKIGFISWEKNNQGRQFFEKKRVKVKDKHTIIPYLSEFRTTFIKKHAVAKNYSRLLCRDGVARQLPIMKTNSLTHNTEMLIPYLDNIKMVCVETYKKLKAIIKLNACFDTIKSIKSIGEKLVYDLTVQDEHCFYANGILVHNCDESHRLKSLKSQVSQATRSVIGAMDYRRIASGTILFNTVDDIHGQTALLNPGILTDMKAEIEANTIVDNNGKITGMNKQSDDSIMSIMNPYVSRMVFRRRDWAFLLPRMNFSFLQCDMTDNHKAYYNKKVEEKIEDLMKDERIKKVLESEDQEKIDKLMKSLDTNFSGMEILLNCPDTDEAFRNLSTTTREDLIPPKSKLVNQIIQAHFTGGTVTDVEGNSVKFAGTKTKIVVFGYNRAVSLEIFKYLAPNYKGQFVHYSAGDKDAVLRFSQDPNIIGIVADETSVREGFNWTFASHVIRLQALWTPGAEEQAMARIFRADTKNQYARKELYVTQIMCRDSLDIAKTARNISKKVNNLKESEGDRPDWKRFVKNTSIPDLDTIKMNLKLLRDKGRVENVGRYFSAYRDINLWDFEESKEITAGLARAVSQKMGIPEDQVDIETLRANAATPFMATGKLDNSKAIWTPLYRTSATILDKLGLGLKPLAIVKAGSNESEEDEDDSENEDDLELEDNVTYSEGDMVITEFGIGFIRNLRQGRIGSKNEGKNTSVNVFIPGFQKYYPSKDYVNLSLLEVFKPTNDELAAQIEKRLNKLAAKNQGILFVKDGIAAVNIKDILSKVSPADIKKPKVIDLPPPVIKPAKHPGVNPANDLDLNDIVPADRTGKKPPVVEPPARNRKDNEIAPPAPGMKPLVKPPTIVAPKDTTTQRKPKLMDDDDVVAKPKNKTGIPPLPPGLDEKNRNKILNDFNKSPDKLYHYQKQTDTHSVVIDAAVINGEITFITYPGEENFGALEGASPDRWNRVPPCATFVFIKVKTYQGAVKLCDRLENEFTLIDGTTDRILKLAKAMQSKSRPAVEQNQKMDFASLKNFVLINHKAPTTDNGLKLYPTVYDGFLYIIASYPTQQKSVRRLMNYNITGCDKPKLNRPVSGYLFFRNKNAALRGLQEIATELHVVNYAQVEHDLKTMPIFTQFVGR